MINNFSRNLLSGSLAYHALEHDKHVATLLKQAQESGDLSEQIRRLLPPALRLVITNILVSQQRVVIFVPSAAAASRVKLSTTKLLEESHRRDWKIDDIRVRVQPNERTKDQIMPKKTPVSTLTVERILTTSKFAQNQPLATALKKLSKTLEKTRTLEQRVR